MAACGSVIGLYVAELMLWMTGLSGTLKYSNIGTVCLIYIEFGCIVDDNSQNRLQ